MQNQNLLITPIHSVCMNPKGTGLELPLIAALIVILVGAVAITSLQPTPPLPGPFNLSEKPIPRFESCSQIQASFVSAQAENQNRYYGLNSILGVVSAPMASGTAKQEASSDSSAPRYSSTNVQVSGVDEADIVKTNGELIFTLSGNYLTISKAYPANEAKLLAKIKLDNTGVVSAAEPNIDSDIYQGSNFYPQELFLEKDKLLVIGNANREIYPVPLPNDRPITATGAPANSGMVAPDYYPYYNNSQVTVLQIWDVSDSSNPKIVRTAEFEGNYVSSRKINDRAFFVVSAYPRYSMLEKPMIAQDQEKLLPVYRETKGALTNAITFKPQVGCADVGYFAPIRAENFITIGSLSLTNLNDEIQKETVVGNAENVYASLENLYVAQTEWNYQDPTPIEPVNNAIRPFISGQQYTVVHKFSLANKKPAYVGNNRVPGHILNQFSMDEFEGNFRIATTIGEVWNTEQKSTNNIYVLDKGLKQVGSLEDLAPGEKIYSVRFMGKRGYMVTFKKVDPLFVIDLADPTNPKVLGKLKIPGYSDYLHPFDETHIIGIGKDAIDASEELTTGRGLDFAWYQGVKIAVFDVSDVANPIEMHKIIIGDRGTDSIALQEHKAFLFDREKELLVIPITLAEIPDSQKTEQPDSRFPQYGEFTFQGALVYNLNLQNGFTLKGRITHDPADAAIKSGYNYGNYETQIKRSLFIGDVLYTVSNQKIKLNDLSNLNELNTIDFGIIDSGNYGYYR